MNICETCEALGKLDQRLYGDTVHMEWFCNDGHVVEMSAAEQATLMGMPTLL
jgi:hypothetical protein